MGAETIKKIEEKIRNNAGLEQDKKTELLKLMGNLKQELEQLQKTDSSKAKTIAALAGASADKAFNDDAVTGENPENPFKELETSVEEFEVTHPRLVRVINRICIMFSSIGI